MDDAMKVKWERQRSDTGGRRVHYRLRAILVDNKREHGELKEEVIVHLASIEERYLKTNEVGMRAFHQGLFWTVADKKMTEIELEPKVRKGIEAEISEVVPRPTDQWGLWAVKCIPEYEK